MTTIDKHNAETLRAIADGKTIQVYEPITGSWKDVCPTSVLKCVANNDIYSYLIRVKPSTIKIGSYDVPEPMQVAPEIGATYYFVHLINLDNYGQHEWGGGVFDTNILNKRICHLTKEAAKIHAAALLSLTV